MSPTRATFLNPRNSVWVLLRILPTSSAKLRTLSMAEAIGSDQFVSSFHTSSISEPMSYFLCKSVLFSSGNARNSQPPSILGFLQNPNFCIHRQWFVSTSSDQQSFIVWYLTNTIGLSPKTALSVSKHSNFKTSEKPDKLVNLFRKFGFTQIQISSLFKRYPRLLLLDAEKNILPKLEFFEAKGITGPEMAKMLSTFPRILSASLTEQIIPSFDFFTSLFQSDEKLIRAVKRCPDILVHNIEKYVTPNIDVLREYGVPDSNIATLLLRQPRIFTTSLAQFRGIVEKVVEMGFDASKSNFVLAVNALRSMSKSMWESKVNTYKKLGWSKEDVLRAFHRSPQCMTYSKDKIMAGMDFFINKMGSRPSHIANHPKLLSLSLKERLIPRYLVFQALLSKGFVEEVSLSALFDTPEKEFLQKFVLLYEKEAPELLELYKEKPDVSDVQNLFHPAKPSKFTVCYRFLTSLCGLLRSKF